MLPSFVAGDMAGFCWNRGWDFSAESRSDGAGQRLERPERLGLARRQLGHVWSGRDCWIVAAGLSF